MAGSPGVASASGLRAACDQNPPEEVGAREEFAPGPLLVGEANLREADLLLELLARHVLEDLDLNLPCANSLR